MSATPRTDDLTWNPLDHGLQGLPIMVPASEYNRIKAELAEANAKLAEANEVLSDIVTGTKKINSAVDTATDALIVMGGLYGRNMELSEKLAESEAGNARLRGLVEKAFWLVDNHKYEEAYNALTIALQEYTGRSPLEAVREAQKAVGYIAEILADKRIEGVSIHSGNTAFKSLERWSDSAPSRLHETFGTCLCLVLHNTNLEARILT